ncbi:MAG: ubiquinol-cytochrome C chaperone [Rhizobiaceae bacterium]|nr:ubiquinol-cytochrome C chaperone [Rhizobiaceae bacterium]
MILNLFRKKRANSAIIKHQYEELTDAARQLPFYRDMNVPDTVLGRFEMLSIFMMLYLRATKNKGDAVEGLAQDIIDAFFEDIDHSIRELGIGDAGVPKRMKKLAGMFYGRADSYGKAIEKNDIEELKTALVRNLFPENIEDAPDMSELGRYLIATDTALKNFDVDQMAQGNLKIVRA